MINQFNIIIIKRGKKERPDDVINTVWKKSDEIIRQQQETDSRKYVVCVCEEKL